MLLCLPLFITPVSFIYDKFYNNNIGYSRIFLDFIKYLLFKKNIFKHNKIEKLLVSFLKILIWRVIGMRYSDFAKGIATGMLVGAAASMIFEPISEKQKNKIKRKTKGVFRSVGSVIDTAFDIMK